MSNDKDSELIDTKKSDEAGERVGTSERTTKTFARVVMKRKQEMPKAAIITMAFLVLAAMIAIAVIFLSGNKVKKSGAGEETGSLASGQTLAERKRVAFHRMRYEKELNAIEEEHGRSQRQEELQRQDSGAVVIPNVQIKVESRIGENKLDLEVTMPNEERLLYVCVPAR